MWEHLKHLGALLLLTLTLAAVATVFSLKAYRGLYLAMVAKDWPEAQATVIDQTKREEVFDRQPRMTTAIFYRYEVNGRECTGEERSEEETVGVAEKLLEDYPVGHVFVIHYNPADPTVSVIDTSFSGKSLLYLAIAVIGMVGALTMLCAFFAACRRSKERS